MCHYSWYAPCWNRHPEPSLALISAHADHHFFKLLLFHDQLVIYIFQCSLKYLHTSPTLPHFTMFRNTFCSHIMSLSTKVITLLCYITRVLSPVSNFLDFRITIVLHIVDPSVIATLNCSFFFFFFLILHRVVLKYIAAPRGLWPRVH